MSFLLVERGPDTGRRLPLKAYPAVVGRDPAADVVIGDSEISRFHLRIKKRGRLYILEDLNSKNGTYLNGDKIRNAVVHSGDHILAGNTDLVFVAPELSIKITPEIFKYDMQLVEELGISGPIDFNSQTPGSAPSPIRLGNNSDRGGPLTAAISKKIFDLYGDITVYNELPDAGQSLLKATRTLLPKLSRGAVMVWSASTGKLIPVAAHTFGRKKTFLISQRLFEDALTRKQGIFLPPDKSPSQTDLARFVLPIMRNGVVSCLVHLESDFPIKKIPPELSHVSQLYDRCAPLFETLLLHQELDGWMVGMIETMIATIEAKDTYTYGHSERVSRYAMAIADQLKLGRDIKRLLLISSLCHDIGKIGIPDAILKKASLLSSDEYEEMKLHPTIGADIISHMPNAERFLSGVKYHHEKWDGTGYPEGLSGEEIPFFGRIISVADAYDAMISGRSYSGFVDASEAIERLLEEHELFDPDILKAFVRAYESGNVKQKTSTKS